MDMIPPGESERITYPWPPAGQLLGVLGVALVPLAVAVLVSVVCR
jgi:hypothetical protein